MKSPAGTIVTLHNRGGGSADNLVGWYATEVTPSGPGSLNDFIGENASGNWYLNVDDNYSQDTEKEHLKWYTFEEVNELVKTEPRPVLVDVYTDWCGWCKKMDKATYEHPDIVKYLNDNYYAVKFNAEQKETMTMGDKIYKFIDNGRRGYHEMAVILTKGRLSYPTIVYLDKDLRHLDVVPGFVNAEQFEIYLAYFNEGADKKTTIDKYAQNFKGKLSTAK